MRRQSEIYDYGTRRDYPEYSSSRGRQGRRRGRGRASMGDRRTSSDDIRTSTPRRSSPEPPYPTQRQQSPRPRGQSSFGNRGNDLGPPRRRRDSEILSSPSVSTRQANGLHGAAIGAEKRDSDMDTMSAMTLGTSGSKVKEMNTVLMDFANVVSDLSVLKYRQSLAKDSYNKWAEEDENVKNLPHDSTTMQAHISAQKKAADNDVRRFDDEVGKLRETQVSLAAQLAEFMSDRKPDDRGLRHEVGALDRRCGELSDDLRHIRDKQDLLHRDNDLLPQLLESQENQEARLNSIQQRVDQLQNAVTAVERQQSRQDLRAEIDEMGRAVRSLESIKTSMVSPPDLDSLKAKVETLDTALQQQIASRSDLEKVQSETFTDISSRIQDSRVEVQAQAGKLTKLEAEFDSLHYLQEPMVDAIGEETEKIKSRLTEHDKTIAQQDNTIAELSKANDSLTARCDEIDRKIQPISERSVSATPTTSARGNSNPTRVPHTAPNVELKAFHLLQDKVKSLTVAVKTLDGRYNNLTTEPVVRAMAQTMAAMYPSVGNAEAEFIALRENLVAIKGLDRKRAAELAGINEQISKLQLVDLVKDLKDCQNTLREMENIQNRNAEKDERNVQVMTRTRDEFRDQLVTIQQQIDGGLARVDEALNDLKKRQTLLETKSNTINGTGRASERPSSRLNGAEGDDTNSHQQEHLRSSISGRSDGSQVGNGSPIRSDPLRKSLLKTKKQKVSEGGSESDDMPLSSMRRQKR